MDLIWLKVLGNSCSVPYLFSCLTSTEKLSISAPDPSWEHGQETYADRDNIRSTVFIKFAFDRAIGFYVLQVYIPLTIIVMSSWVSFWLIKTEKGQETPARTGLGSTTVLAVVTIGFGFVGGTKESNNVPGTNRTIPRPVIIEYSCFL